MSALVEAHIEAQRRLRERVSGTVATAWRGLPAYDEQNVAQFLGVAVPTVTAGKRASVAVTTAFLARRTGRQPAHVDVAKIIGAVRGGVPAEEVYRRPFVTVWTALKDGTDYRDAVSSGLQRAASSAAMDVQLTMRQTLQTVGEADDLIVGYQRVPDGGACEFCQLVAGQRYTVSDLMPVHNHCGCGVDVITSDNRGDFTGKPENDLSVTHDGVTAAVEDHGELGPLLVNGDQHFTSL